MKNAKKPKGEAQAKYQKDPAFLEFVLKFSTREACLEYLEKRRWPNGAICPKCKSEKAYKLNGKSTKPGTYKCAGCKRLFNVTTGTFLESTHIPLPRWFAAMFLMASSKKSISAHQIHRMLGVCYESAWFMCHRIRHSLRIRDLRKTFRGTVEADETYVGGKKRKGRPAVPKAAVMGIVQRRKHIVLKPIPDASKPTLQGLIKENVFGRAKLMTDDWTGYIGLGRKFEHRKIVHSKGQYARRDGKISVHTNTIEGAFSLVKRAVFGTYHHVSADKLSLYCDEWAFRYSHRMLTDSSRFERMLDKPEGRLKWYFKNEDIGTVTSNEGSVLP